MKLSQHRYLKSGKACFGRSSSPVEATALGNVLVLRRALISLVVSY